MAGIGYGLSQSMRLGQTLAPQMRHSLEMLQMTQLDLRAELQRQLQQNPVIEEVDSKMERPLSEALPEEHVSGTVTERELDFSPTGEMAQQTLSSDDGYRDYFLQNMENFSPGTDSGTADPEAPTRRQLMFDRQVRDITLQEHLIDQVPLADMSDKDRIVAETLIGNIDDDGYFRGSLADIQMVTGESEKHLLALLKKISAFDPLGCGGRNLRECLLAQMSKLDDSPWEDEVRSLIDKHLPDIAAKRVDLICKELGLTPAEYEKALAALRSLEPHPGRGFRRKVDESQYVRPEVFAAKDAKGRWKVSVSSRDLPRIRISRRYITMLEDPSCSAEAKAYIMERVRAAEALIESLEERQETIRRIAQAIVDAQPEAMEKGLSACRPLTMEQIAEKTGVHNTTVSRTVRDKYMSTPFGTVQLKRFFVSGLATDKGEMVSNVSVKDAIRKLVEEEDAAAPLSDDRIAAILKGRGISIARRTVAKYRGEMGIPGTNERRVLSS